MDILLRTNTKDPRFELRACTRLDSNDYRCVLHVASSPFRADVEFWFDQLSLVRMLAGLRAMEKSLRGECSLGHAHEESFFAVRGDGLGHIEVAGLLVCGPQRLEFRLETDQTVLGSFASDFASLVESARAL